jgi:hypothetical protein
MTNAAFRLFKGWWSAVSRAGAASVMLNRVNRYLRRSLSAVTFTIGPDRVNLHMRIIPRTLG